MEELRKIDAELDAALAHAHNTYKIGGQVRTPNGIAAIVATNINAITMELGGRRQAVPVAIMDKMITQGQAMIL